MNARAETEEGDVPVLLLTRFERDFENDFFVLAGSPQDGDLHDVAGLVLTQAIGEIVDILDRRGTELRDDILALEPAFLRRTSFADARYVQSLRMVRIVRDDPEHDIETGTRRLGRLHFHIVRRGGP